MIITDCIFSPQFDVFDILFEDPFRKIIYLNLFFFITFNVQDKT